MMLQTLSQWLAMPTMDIVMSVFATGLGHLLLLGARLVAGAALLPLELCFWLIGRRIATSGNYMPMFMVHSSWEDALFLHWEVGANELQELLPAGLEPDLWDGKAYVGLVLLTERGIHPALFPRLSAKWLSITHLAANVRTYVRPKGDPHATPGVYFFSLDASSWPASAGASILFGLPYHPACMDRTWEPMKHRCRFSSRRCVLNAVHPVICRPEILSTRNCNSPSISLRITRRLNDIKGCDAANHAKAVTVRVYMTERQNLSCWP